MQNLNHSSAVLPQSGYKTMDTGVLYAGDQSYELFYERLLPYVSRSQDFFSHKTPPGSTLRSLACVSRVFASKFTDYCHFWFANHMRLQEQLYEIKSQGFTESSNIAHYIQQKKFSIAFFRATEGLTTELLSEFLKNAPEVKHLIISRCGLKGLPLEAKSLITFTISRCNNFSKFPQEMRYLEYLKCRDSDSIKSLPERLPNARKVICLNLDLLVKLPVELPNAKLIRLQKCLSLRRLPIELPNLRKLYCASCPEVKELSILMREIRKIDCSHCTNLTKIIGEFMKLREFLCWGCPVKALPKMPVLQSLDCSECPNLPSLDVIKENLPENCNVHS